MLYSRQEIANILQGLGSVERAIEEEKQEPEPYERGRRAGFNAALISAGLCFGLRPMLEFLQSDGPIWIEGLTNEEPNCP